MNEIAIGIFIVIVMLFLLAYLDRRQEPFDPNMYRPKEINNITSDRKTIIEVYDIQGNKTMVEYNVSSIPIESILTSH